MTTRQEQAIETEAKIVRTALGLMHVKGYENVSIREICEAAGISTGAFYHYFKSKEDMINIGFGTYDEYLAGVLEAYTGTDPMEMLRFVLINQTEYVIHQTGSLTAELYRALLSSNDKYAVHSDRLYYRTVQACVERCLKEGRLTAAFSADYLTELLIRVIRGDIIDWCLHEYSYDLIAYAEKDLEIVFKGLFYSEQNKNSGAV